MKVLSILMVGVALLLGGCEKPTPIQGVSYDKLEYREGILYYKGGDELFTGTAIEFLFNNRYKGSKIFERSFVDGILHGAIIKYYEDGTKEAETPYVNGKKHGTAISYNREGSKTLEIVFENWKEISRKEF